VVRQRRYDRLQAILDSVKSSGLAGLTHTDDDGYTPLALAVENHDSRCVEIILRALGPDAASHVASRTPDSPSVLHAAIGKYRSTCLRAILAACPDAIDRVDEAVHARGDSAPLLQSVTSDCLRAVVEAVGRPAVAHQLRAHNHVLETPFMTAVRNDFDDLLDDMLRVDPRLLFWHRECDEFGLLHVAAWHDSTRCTRKIIGMTKELFGGDALPELLRRRCHTAGGESTALELAVAMRSHDCVRVLLQFDRKLASDKAFAVADRHADHTCRNLLFHALF